MKNITMIYIRSVHVTLTSRTEFCYLKYLLLVVKIDFTFAHTAILMNACEVLCRPWQLHSTIPYLMLYVFGQWQNEQMPHVLGTENIANELPYSHNIPGVGDGGEGGGRRVGYFD